MDIPGAQAANYTTPPVTVADDGAAFQCVVTNTVGMTTSGAAMLTVSVGVANNAPQIVTGTIAFTKQIIDDGTVDETHFVVAADLDGDSDIDVVATDFVDDMVPWYENDGSGSFIKQTIDANLDGAYPAHIADVDGDGDTDVLAAGYVADTVAWYENDGSGGFTRHNVDTAADGAHSVVTGDMDQDGDTDLLTTNQDAGTITWYENDGNQSFTRHTIDNSASGAKRAEFADIDNDGDLDVVSASFDVDEIAWHENDGNQNFTKRLIDTSANGAYFVSVTDIDGDGAIDVLAASQLDNTIAWYQNNGGGSFTMQTIDTNAAGARTVIAVDIDGDGDNDALTASVNDDTLAWYRNDGNGIFAKQTIDLAADGAYGVFATDMDADGDIDVLSASRDANAVALHLHIKAHVASLDMGGTLVIDSSLLQTTDVDDVPAALTYTVPNVPDFGDLRLNGIPLSDGGTFTQDDIDNNRVGYVHNGLNSSPDMFAFMVADGGENGVGPATGTFSFNILDPAAVLVVLPLDEGSGSVAGDTSGMGNNGALINGPVFEANTPDGSPFAVRFDGADDFIDLGPLDVNGSGLTLAAWFNADSFPGPSGDPRLISKASGAAANDHVFMLSTVRVGSAMRLRARMRVGGVTTTLIATSGDLATGVWQHAALTYDGMTVRLYLDGIEVGNTPLSGTVDTRSRDPSGGGRTVARRGGPLLRRTVGRCPYFAAGAQRS